MKEPLIYERIVPLASIVAVLEKLRAQTLREGDVSVSMEGIDRYDLAFLDTFKDIETTDEMLEKILEGLKKVKELHLSEEEKKQIERLDLEGEVSFVRAKSATTGRQPSGCGVRLFNLPGWSVDAVEKFFLARQPILYVPT